MTPKFKISTAKSTIVALALYGVCRETTTLIGDTCQELFYNCIAHHPEDSPDEREALAQLLAFMSEIEEYGEMLCGMVAQTREQLGRLK
jgi:hypothetical protein